MRFQTVRTPLTRVRLEDDFYRITTASVPEAWVASIGSTGLINPPICVPWGSEYQIVSGFRRIEAIRRLGRRQVLVRIPDGDADPLAAARIAIADNSGQRALNPVELSRCFNLLTTTGGVPLQAIARPLGLPSNPDVIRRLS